MAKDKKNNNPNLTEISALGTLAAAAGTGTLYATRRFHQDNVDSNKLMFRGGDGEVGNGNVFNTQRKA